MTLLEFERFKKSLLEEIINEVNIKQGIPITFVDIELEEKTVNKFEGTLLCHERSPRKWRIPLVAEIEGDKVKWNANELSWYSFDGCTTNFHLIMIYQNVYHRINRILRIYQAMLGENSINLCNSMTKKNKFHMKM